ncbi:MAG: chitobiase/beta-hexosaminidase C-terminal domain-containing protein, partial [Eubacterium sp.]
TGDIKAVKGSTSQTVALVVQGNDGTNNWYYSKQITGTDVVNVSDIVEEANTPASIDLSTCKIWLEITDSAENLTYAVNATETTIRIIHSVAITGIDTPVSNTALDTEASCVTEGVSSTTPQITWTPSDTTAGYNTSYTASITLTAATGYEFTDSTTATVMGNAATSVNKNPDGTLTVTYDFLATAKDKLISITAPQAITVANGTTYDAMNLPATVNIVTEGNTVSSAPVVWNTTTPAGGSYDPSVLTGQTVTLTGMVTCPDSINDNGIPLTTTITITISAAGIVGAPTANPTAGTYTENQSVTLASSTEGATIYYTTDGSEPTITGGVPAGTTAEYTAPIAVTGTEGQSITTTIKAIAVKGGMQDSSVETFTYTIQLPDVTAPSITTQPGNATVKAGETATFTIVASGTDLTYQWQIDRNDGNGWVNIAGATATSYTTSTVDMSCNGFKYQCVVSNSAGTVTSNTAVLTVTENTTPDPDPVDYEILDGANSSWTQNSDGSLSIRGSGEFSKFVGVKVDGNLVDAKNYTVKEGSTIVTLKADYLNTLSVGSHTFEMIWTDGTASTNFTIKEDTSDNSNNNSDSSDDKPSSETDKKDDVPKTGDNTPIVWLFILSILSGTGLIITVKKRRENLNS